MVKRKDKDPPNRGGEMCSVGKNGTSTNGEIMQSMLGDEPDVSHTSLALAKKLRLSTQTLKMLGATPADIDELDAG